MRSTCCTANSRRATNTWPLQRLHVLRQPFAASLGRLMDVQSRNIRCTMLTTGVYETGQTLAKLQVRSVEVPLVYRHQKPKKTNNCHTDAWLLNHRAIGHEKDYRSHRFASRFPKEAVLARNPSVEDLCPSSRRYRGVQTPAWRAEH